MRSSRKRPNSFRTRPSTIGSGSSRNLRATSTSTAEHRYTLVDVFTDVPLAGNPLAVVHDCDLLDDQTMLAFARETRLSETTFVQSSTAPGASYRNRIFSMAGELPFAGHPSLGTAVAVARAAGTREAAAFTQQTAAGLQPITVELEGERVHASMLQEPAQFGAEVEPKRALAALGLRPSDAHRELTPQVVSTGLSHLMLPLASVDAVGRIAADPLAVDAVLADIGAFGIYAAWCEPDRGHARTRAFCRSAQVAEDPATGSAAGPLCAYLHRYASCERLDVIQGVELGRSSRIETEMAGDRVRLGGDIVVVIDGTVRL